MKKIFFLLFVIFFYTTSVNANTKKDELYKKIDLFSEVLEKIRKEYVDEVDQSQLIDDAINGALQSLDPYSAYMDSELFESSSAIQYPPSQFLLFNLSCTEETFWLCGMSRTVKESRSFLQ